MAHAAGRGWVATGCVEWKESARRGELKVSRSILLGVDEGDIERTLAPTGTCVGRIRFDQLLVVCGTHRGTAGLGELVGASPVTLGALGITVTVL